MTDADAAQDEAQDGQERDDGPVTNSDSATCQQKARKRRADILDAAEADGAAGVWSVLHGLMSSVQRSKQGP